MDFFALDFSAGLAFKDRVQHLLRSPIVPSSASRWTFQLVVAFGRCKFRLSEDSVGHLLYSALGGDPSSFKVIELEDKIFKFSVFSQHVGFMIYHQKEFSCTHFKCFFHLWNADGLAAARLSITKESQPKYQWVEVNKKKSYATVVKEPGNILTGANRVPVGSHHKKASNAPRCAAPGGETMAYQRVDPTPFIPLGLQWEDVPHRVQAIRVVTARAQRMNEDIAIVHLDPLPANQVFFGNVGEILQEFLVDMHGVRIKDIQPSPLGQAFVQFYHVIRFEKHDEGHNHRALNFNRKCWVMLLNFPLDYRRQRYIEDAVGPFAKLTSWEDVPRRLARVVAQIRVTDLESIPHFIAFSVGDGFQGDSWTIQCEIIEHQLLGALPADEDPAPSPEHILEAALDLNQPINGANEDAVDQQAQADITNVGEEVVAIIAGVQMNIDEESNFLVEEIPHDQLMDGYQSSNSSSDKLQVGMVRVHLPSADPVFESFSATAHSHSVEATKLWSKFFSPSSGLSYSILAEWSDFVTLLLMSPSCFGWASAMIKARVWDSMLSDRGQLNKGFKKGTCLDRNCLACTVSPPTISQSVIRNLGASFCKINADSLSDEVLNANTKSAPIGRKQKAKKKSSDPDVATTKKMSKK
ncbi:hypothetical protein BS78_01G253900 [Paspalum vaginatum]|nr:hypothetical protein BS78_01G253900 [Paspalum vaginatum]